MNGFIRTVEFDAWLKDLRDPIGKARILARVRSAEQGTTAIALFKKLER